jgi:antitoxin ParD1/3/4/toxin ParE1/3/4
LSRYVLSPDAAGDLVEIWRYICERGSQEAADRVEDSILRTISTLAISPGIGHRRPDLLSGDVRFFAIYSYLIVYRESPGPLQVIAILHGAREVRSILEGRT